MIFVTVGTQLPFARLLEGMNREAARLGVPVIAQSGPGATPQRWPHLQVHDHLAPPEFEGLFRAADLVVGHAGIGTVLSAQRFGKPLLIVPRRAALGEHRNDHQMATAAQLENRPGLRVVWDIEALGAALDARHDLQKACHAPGPEQAALIRGLSDFINQS